MNYWSTYCVHCCSYFWLSIYNQLWVFVYCLLEDGYGFVPHLSPVVCKDLHFIIQQCLAVLVEAELFWEATYAFCIVRVIVRNASVAARMGRPDRRCGSLLVTIGRLLLDHIALFLEWVTWIVPTSVSGGVGRIVPAAIRMGVGRIIPTSF